MAEAPAASEGGGSAARTPFRFIRTELVCASGGTGHFHLSFLDSDWCSLCVANDRKDGSDDAHCGFFSHALQVDPLVWCNLDAPFSFFPMHVIRRPHFAFAKKGQGDVFLRFCFAPAR